MKIIRKFSLKQKKVFLFCWWKIDVNLVILFLKLIKKEPPEPQQKKRVILSLNGQKDGILFYERTFLSATEEKEVNLFWTV